MKTITIEGCAVALLAAGMSIAGGAHAAGPTTVCNDANEGQSTWVWTHHRDYDVGDLYVCVSGYWELRRRCFSNSPTCMEF